MKKILRLVTTSVLTLTLVACGEASSSVSTSGTQTSSSVPSVSSAYANVTSVTLSAATATLTQVLGSQRTVQITAALNANTNPGLSIEWFVNGVKQAQPGRVLEFTPTAVGNFAITAKVGNINSNTLNVVVGLPSIAITSAEFTSDNVIEVKAEGGATVTLVGATLLEDSYYDLSRGTYVLNLDEAVKQGGTVTVRLERAGFATQTRAVVYDTQVFALDEVVQLDQTVVTGFDIPVVAGAYQIVKPLEENFTKTIRINLEHEGLLSTTSVNFGFETTVPTGATAFVPQNQLLTGSDATVLFRDIEIKSDTAPGLYTHKVTLGNKSVEIKVNVLPSNAEIALYEGVTANFRADVNKDFVVEQYAARVVETTASTPAIPVNYLTPNADGVFVITKPFETILESGTNFLTDASVGKEFKLDLQFLFRNFAESDIVGINNQYSITLEGPAEFGGRIALSNMPYEGSTQLLLPSFQNFGSTGNATAMSYSAYTYGSAETSGVYVLTQKFDRTTLAGDYVFTVKVGQVGSEIEKKVTVRLVEPAAKLDFVVNGLTVVQGTNRIAASAKLENDRVVIDKPAVAGITHEFSFFTVLQNHFSKVATQEETVVDSIITVKKDKQLFPYADVTITEAEAIRMGNLGSVTTQVQTGTETGIFHKYVDFSLSVSGPSELITPVSNKKLAILPADGKDSLVIYNATGYPVNANAFTSYRLDVAYDSYDLANLQIINDFLRNSLSITNLTVTGTYKLTFKVDNLVRTVDLVIQEPTAKLVLSANGVQVDAFGFGAAAFAGSANALVWNTTNTATFRDADKTTKSVYYFENNKWNLVPNTRIGDARPTLPTKLGDVWFDSDDSTGTMYVSRLAFDAPITAVITGLTASATRTQGQYHFISPKLYRYIGPTTTQAAVATVDQYVEITNFTSGTTLPATNLFVGQIFVDTTTANSETVNIVTGETLAWFSLGVSDVIKDSFNKLPYNISENTSGEYVIQTTMEQVLTANAVEFDFDVRFANLLPGTYNYSVKKTLPDGTVDVWNDTATVSAAAASALSVGLFSPTPASTAPGVTFATEWDVGTVASAKIGTYSYEFTFGTLTKKVTVNVEEMPMIKINTVNAFSSTTDNQNLPLFAGAHYILQSLAVGRTYVMSMTGELAGLTEDQYYTIKLATETASKLLFAADDLYGTPTAGTTVTTEKSLKVVSKVALGTIETDAIATAIDALTYELNFFNKVPASVATNTGLITYTNVPVGVTQVVSIKAIP